MNVVLVNKIMNCLIQYGGVELQFEVHIHAVKMKPVCLGGVVIADIFSCLDASTAKVNDTILLGLEFCKVAVTEEAKSICKKKLITEKQESGGKGA